MPGLTVLGIETSTAHGSVALCRGRQLMARHRFPEGRRHARQLMVAIDQLVRETQVGRRDVHLVAVSEGPGSFNGLRIGTTCARTLAWALGWNAVGVPTLAVKAENVEPAEFDGARFACPVQDARRGRVYATIFQHEGGRWQERTGVLVETAHEAAHMIPQGAVVFGSGVQSYPEAFTPDRFRIGPPELDLPRAEAVCRLGQRKFQTEGPADPMKLVPRYYRLTAPEEKLRKQHNGPKEGQ